MAKKIGAIVSLSLIGVLIIATIILANVKINYSINCENPTAVWVSYSNKAYNKVTDEQANKIIDYINNASKENTLSALFNGNLSKKAEISKAESSSKKPASNSGFYVEYAYNTPQKLMYGNKAHESGATYQRLLFTINNTNEVNEVSVYVFSTDTTEYYSYYYTLEANFNDLYNYLMACGLNK